MRLDSKGELIWEKHHELEDSYRSFAAFSIAETPNGDLIVAGNTNHIDTPNNFDRSLIHLSRDGEIFSQQRTIDNVNSNFRAVRVLANETYLLVGSKLDSTYYWVLNSAGDVLSETIQAECNQDFFYDLAFVDTGAIAILGRTRIHGLSAPSLCITDLSGHILAKWNDSARTDGYYRDFFWLSKSSENGLFLLGQTIRNESHTVESYNVLNLKVRPDR